MQKWENGKARCRTIRSRVKWMMAVLLVCVLGTGAVYLRMESGNQAITVTAPFRPQYSANETPSSSIDLVKELSGTRAFAAQYGTTGAGQRIALIDSGIDLSHEVFGPNRDGTPKVAAYYDYTDEGLLYTTAAEQDGDKVSLYGTQYRIGGIYNQADCYYMAFLQLDMLEPQLIDGKSDEIAVLVLASGIGQEKEVYDCVYLDTNRNGDFTDEVPMRWYGEDGSHSTLYHAGYPIDIALTEIASDGKSVQFSADTLGHGTFLAGILAGNGEQYSGIAPEAQLFIYKIFDKAGASSQQRLAEAILQAVADDVDCINLSLSIPKEEKILPALSAALYRAHKEGIPIVAAAGNLGPGHDTIAYPARESFVIGVGSVTYPAQYLQDCAVLLEQHIIPDYSGRGSMDGSTAPLLAAPSGVIGAVPRWYQEAYMYDYGTSISAAIVTGAICHLTEWADMQGDGDFSDTRIAAILAQGAQDLGISGAAQGYGALSMAQLQLDVKRSNPSPRRVAEQAVYTPEFAHPFVIPQGEVQSWQIDISEDTHLLEISFAVNTESAGVHSDQRIAMGRCRMYVYRPDGTLAEATDYIGASYGARAMINDSSIFRNPQAGIWEVVIASADNLSVYQHFASYGVLHVKAK